MCDCDVIKSNTLIRNVKIVRESVNSAFGRCDGERNVFNLLSMMPETKYAGR